MNALLATIGNTPLVQLRSVVPEGCGQVWVKVESSNPTGSYKDRMAFSIVNGAKEEGFLDGKKPLECTGGSTGTSLAFVCAVMDLDFTVITSDAFAKEKTASMAAYGASVILEPSRGGLISPELWQRMRTRAQALVETGSYHWLDQFNNPYTAKAFEIFADEVANQMSQNVDAFCAAVGTAGMLVGAGRRFKQIYPSIRIVAVEPETCAVLSGGKPGKHSIDGTAAGFIPPLYDPAVVNDVLALAEEEARAMARRLASEEGIFAGTSTGLNVLAAISLGLEMGPDSTIVTVACDSGFKYLNGTLFAQ